MMRISVFYDHLKEAARQTGKDLPELFAETAALGIHGLEIEAKHYAQDQRMIDVELDRNGLEISSVFEFFDFGKNPDDIARARRVVDMTAELGCPRLMVIPGFLSEEEGDDLNRPDQSYASTAEWLSSHAHTAAMRNALASLVPYAASQGVTLTMEEFDSHTSP